MNIKNKTYNKLGLIGLVFLFQGLVTTSAEAVMRPELARSEVFVAGDVETQSASCGGKLFATDPSNSTIRVFSQTTLGLLYSYTFPAGVELGAAIDCFTLAGTTYVVASRILTSTNGRVTFLRADSAALVPLATVNPPAINFGLNGMTSQARFLPGVQEMTCAGFCFGKALKAVVIDGIAYLFVSMPSNNQGAIVAYRFDGGSTLTQVGYVVGNGSYPDEKFGWNISKSDFSLNGRRLILAAAKGSSMLSVLDVSGGGNPQVVRQINLPDQTTAGVGLGDAVIQENPNSVLIAVTTDNVLHTYRINDTGEGIVANLVSSASIEDFATGGKLPVLSGAVYAGAVRDVVLIPSSQNLSEWGVFDLSTTTQVATLNGVPTEAASTFQFNGYQSGYDLVSYSRNEAFSLQAHSVTHALRVTNVDYDPAIGQGFVLPTIAPEDEIAADVPGGSTAVYTISHPNLAFGLHALSLALYSPTPFFVPGFNFWMRDYDSSGLATIGLGFFVNSRATTSVNLPSGYPGIGLAHHWVFFAPNNKAGVIEFRQRVYDAP